LATNAGWKVRLSCRKSSGAKATKVINVASGVYEDLVKAGVVIPRKSRAQRCRTPRRLPVCC
jgi:hypothetical protein